MAIPRVDSSRFGRRRFRVALCVWGLVALVAGCGTKKAVVRPAGIQTHARQGYLNGLLELESGNYREAMRHFYAVASSPRYFRYTALASLRAADALFGQEQYAKAIDAYQGFIKQFAGNPNIPYAEFRIAQSHYFRIPGNWWFLPPAYEKDLSTTRSAYDALRRFLIQHDRHRFAPQAVRMRDFCARRLYDYEIYVADFHEGRGKPRGIVQRLESALKQFPDQATTEENYMRLAHAYVELEDGAGTRSALERYLTAFPEGERRAEVDEWLAALAEPRPPEDPAPDAEDE